MNLEFQSMANWLKESKMQEQPTYGCVMLYAKIDDWEEKHISGISEKDVYIKQYDDSYGLEEEPHLTLIYGIHEDEIDPQTIYSVMENNLHTISATISSIGVFNTEDCDVVKYEVTPTPDILAFRKLFMKFPNTQDFPDYKPHMTIAYVKKGKGKKYAKKLDEPFTATFFKGVYSWHEKTDGEVEELRKQVVFKHNV